MKKIFLLFGLGLCLALCPGCEWTSGGGVDYWDESGDWVDFSGSYTAADGGILVTSFTSSGGSATTNIVVSTNVVSSELLGTGDGAATTFSGSLSYIPYAGSLNIDVGGYLFWDSADGSGTASLSVTPDDGSEGTINYDTAAWSLSFPAPITSGSQILASYSYLVSTTNIVTPSEQGNHGDAIYSFIVYQTGNTIQIIDSNGTTYEGTIGSVRTSGGLPTDQTTSSTVPTSGPVEAQFSATGVSQGYNVTIVGILQGTLAGTSCSDRTMEATYMEEGGYEANISAVCYESE